MKRGIYTVFESVVKESLSPTDYRSCNEGELAKMIVEHCQLMGIQLIVMDEAGTKTEAEIRGIAYIIDGGR
jgi:hypothetical protein